MLDHFSHEGRFDIERTQDPNTVASLLTASPNSKPSARLTKSCDRKIEAACTCSMQCQTITRRETSCSEFFQRWYWMVLVKLQVPRMCNQSSRTHEKCTYRYSAPFHFRRGHVAPSWSLRSVPSYQSGGFAKGQYRMYQGGPKRH